MLPLVELSEGVLVTPDTPAMVKARSLDLLPKEILVHISDKTEIKNIVHECLLKRVTVVSDGKMAVFDMDYFEYINKLENTRLYLSNVSLPTNENPLHPLVAEYQHGWCVLAPLGV